MNRLLLTILLSATFLAGCTGNETEEPTPKQTNITITPSNTTISSEAQNPAIQTLALTCKGEDDRPDPELNWTLSSNQPWLTLSLDPTGSEAALSVIGTGDQAIYLVAEKNSTDASRTAKLYVNGDARNIVANITQNPKSSDPPVTMTMTTAKMGEVEFFLLGSGNVTIDWGDGQSSIKTLSYYDETFIHTYSNSTARTITISGSIIVDFGCDNNQLTALDVSGNPNLNELYCYTNKLTVLDVSSNAALSRLDCDGNQLSTLELGDNPALRTLYCSYNQLTSLNVSSNTMLKTLGCGNNRLTSLDVSGLNSLTDLNCWSNHMTGAALDELFQSLNSASGSKMISISNNGGSGGVYNDDGTRSCTTSIASGKGWTVNDN